MLPFLSLTDFSSKCSPFLTPFCLSPPFYIALILTLVTTTVLLPTRVLGIFSLTLSVSSPPIFWNSDFWGLFVLFRLSYLYLMRKRLDKNPIINAKAKIFLPSWMFWKFPMVLGISWKPHVDNPCSILRIRLVLYFSMRTTFPRRLLLL